jgi:uncharacterized Zn-binding protein involved in type VI secretion
MSKLAARKGDEHSCPKDEPKEHGTGSIIEGSPNVTFEGMPAARVGDKIECEDGSTTPIADTGSCLLINGKRAARIGDKTDHDGEITSSAGSVFIADGKPFIEFGNGIIIKIGKNVYFGGGAKALDSPVGNARVSSAFGAKRTCNPCSRNHPGTDYGVPTGTDVVATADGTVIRAYRSKTYGNVVIIDHGPTASGKGNVYTLYAHGNSIPVKQGQVISKGKSVLVSGNTGRNTTGPHLHYEVIQSSRKSLDSDFFTKSQRFAPNDLKNILR